MSCKITGDAKLIEGYEHLIPNWCLDLDVSQDKEKLEDPEFVGQCQSCAEYCKAELVLIDTSEDTIIHEICHLHYSLITDYVHDLLFTLNLTPLEVQLIRKQLMRLEETSVANLIEVFKK